VIHDNFIYGEGLKQDYGGHNSQYFNNTNIVHKYDGQNCFNCWPFLSGHEHNYTDNICTVLYTWNYGNADFDASHPEHQICANHKEGEQCSVNLARNKYFTPFGNASIGDTGPTLQQLQQGGVEVGSSVGMLPSNAQIVEWAKEKLHF
jgi:hypothetical protein